MPLFTRMWRSASILSLTFALVLAGGSQAATFSVKQKKYQQVAIHAQTIGAVRITPERIKALFGKRLSKEGFAVTEDETPNRRTLVLKITFLMDDDDDDDDGIPDAKDPDDDGDGVPDKQEHPIKIDLDKELGLKSGLAPAIRQAPHQSLLINILCDEFEVEATSRYLGVIESFRPGAGRPSPARPHLLPAVFFPFGQDASTGIPQLSYESTADVLCTVEPGGTQTVGDELAQTVTLNKPAQP